MSNTFINHGQTGAMGIENDLSGNTFQQIALNLAATDFPRLAAELARLLAAMKEQASEAEHFQALAEVKQAEDAARQQDAAKLSGHLRAAGQWSLGVATGIGVELAAEVLKQALGL